MSIDISLEVNGTTHQLTVEPTETQAIPGPSPNRAPAAMVRTDPGNMKTVATA